MLAALVAPALLAAAPAPPAPTDFSGVWNYATMTPLERPREFAERETLTADVAAQYERQVAERQANTNNTAGCAAGWATRAAAGMAARLSSTRSTFRKRRASGAATSACI